MNGKPFAILAAAFLLAGAALAQTPPSSAWLSGNVEAISADSITLQGLTFPVASGAAFATVLPDGTLAEIPFSDIAPGMPFHGHAVLAEGGFAWAGGYVGNHFFWHGVVTAITRDDAGKPLTITLDDAVTVHVGQARVVGLPPGQQNAGDVEELGAALAEAGEPFLLQEGATVGVGGIARDGIFAAVVVNVAAVDFASTGTISSLATGEGGAVTGFTLEKNGALTSVRLAPFTLIRKGRRVLSPNDLQVGMRVFVTGKALSDGTVVAFEVKVAR